jgi:hypothetical protein
MYELGVNAGLAWNDLVRLFGAVSRGFSDTIATRPIKRFSLQELTCAGRSVRIN